jgi:fructose-1,6-bisphosphatase/inositol monophosphatase family enzyme
MELKELTAAVCQVAQRAGTYIAQERTTFRDEQVERKHAHDYVSYVDKGSEQLIVKALKALLPEAGFVTEEGLAAYHDEQYWWVVDPLDGTTNFIHEFPPYCVSIALCKGHEILVGVVYDITAGECYSAWKGGGAWCDGRRLYVSHRAVNDALLCLQLPYNSDAYRPVIHRLIEAFYGRAASIRMMGSAAMALCYVAAGRLDGYVEQYIGQWDFMAGGLMVREAGGMVSDYAGAEDFTQGNSVVATNVEIHDEILKVIKGE